jgi:hypothetical protein
MSLCVQEEFETISVGLLVLIDRIPAREPTRIQCQRSDRKMGIVTGSEMGKKKSTGMEECLQR